VGTDVVRAHVIVSGRVQGVFYRHSAAERAREHGLAGWVRNIHDGRVEATFQGPRPAVEEMIRWCGMGPPSARVDDVEVSWQPIDAGLTTFAVAG